MIDNVSYAKLVWTFLKAERRSAKYGLGIRAPEVIDDNLDPQTKARKLTLARYHELDWTPIF